MRILAIETATPQGSAALIEDGKCLLSAVHRRPNAHAEELLPLIEQLLNEAQWDRGSLERIAVGVGPGSFTGLRVGIALGQGIASSLGIDVVGIPSLLAMAQGVPNDIKGLRCPVVDARREEVFVAAYDAEGGERLPPSSVPQSELLSFLRGHLAQPYTLVGEFAAELAPDAPQYSDEHSALPHAQLTGLLGGSAEVTGDIVPQYVRAPDAKLPNLPPSPLKS